MNQKLRSGLTTVLLITALGTASSSQADQVQVGGQGYESQLSASEALRLSPSSESSSKTPELSSAATVAQPIEVVKVGERQSQAAVETNAEIVAKIQPHVMAGRSAATLYVRNIPVLTFLGSNLSANSDTKMGEVAKVNESKSGTSAKLATRPNISLLSFEKATQQASGDLSEQSLNQLTHLGSDPDQSDPVWRATAVAAKLNQLSRENLDPTSITLNWQGSSLNSTSKPTAGVFGRTTSSEELSDRYVITVAGQTLIEIDNNTVLPDTTQDLEQDALQVTNRLRRQLGNAPPLQEIPGKPVQPPQAQRSQQISLGPVQVRITGMASWYGPGFHGNRSASGEVFNQNSLTAAHRSLPFGTKVQVTNLDNGRSVVVRINDRGPYAHGRVIDLSAAAAQVLGLINSGVAPVRLEVLGNPKTASADR